MDHLKGEGHYKIVRGVFFVDKNKIKAVNGVSLEIKENTTLGLVGESGCGKSFLAMSLIKIFQSPRSNPKRSPKIFPTLPVSLPFDFLFFLAFNTIIETFQLMIDQYQGVRHT